MKKVFLNCTNHELNQEQIKKAKERFGVKEFISLKEINSELFNRLSSMKLEDDVERLCVDLFHYINNYSSFYDEVYCHLPIGSPFFMAFFFYELIPYVRFNTDVIFVFSYSERKVIEQNINGKTIKKSIFQFIDYQIIKHINDVLR